MINRKLRVISFATLSIICQICRTLLFYINLTNPITCHSAATQKYPSFQIPNSESYFQNQFYDSTSDKLYIGGLNDIYKLSDELELENSVSTGPVEDNQLCRPPPFSCELKKITTDHYNKLILIHENRLITCGNVYQGTCDIRDPDSLIIIVGNSTREVVPNTPSGMAVAFVAYAGSVQVLYVASSIANWLRGIDIIPTVSTRLIANNVSESNLFKVSSSYAKIRIPRRNADTSKEELQFDINYIYGFTSGLFSYFVAFQPSNPQKVSRHVSKLVRLCQGDTNFYSYIELPLVCATDSDNDYNLVQSAHLAVLSVEGNETKEVLVAAFSKSETEINDIPASESAVCIYPVEDINRAFYKRRINCAQQGTVNTEIEWFGSTSCRNSHKLVDAIIGAGPDNYCHNIDTMNPLGADNRVITISATPVYESTCYITAVAAMQHFDTSFIFVGDNTGRLRKLQLVNAVSAVEYKTLHLHRTPVIRNGVILSGEKEYVYVTSDDQISKVPVVECHAFTTCETCHAAQGRYCGWCSLQKECRRRLEVECANSENGASPQWLDNHDRCSSILSVIPEYAQVDTLLELTIVVIGLPPIPHNGSVQCVFAEENDQLGTKHAVVNTNMSRIKCNTPDDITVSSEGFRRVKLQIQYRDKRQSFNIVTILYDFYDCTKISSCFLCAGNKYGCHWCLYSNQCKDILQNCSNDDVRKANDCPRILQSEEILIPAGQRKNIRVHGVNLPYDTVHFSCQIDFGDQDKLAIDAVVMQSGEIVCDTTLYNYPSQVKSKSGSLQVYWGHLYLDFEDEIIVTLYKCDQKAVTTIDGFSQQTCGKCLTIDVRYQCGWCPEISSCLSSVNAGTCPQNKLSSRKMGCSNPTILKVSPSSGHIAGGTRLTIEGYNLGLASADVSGITISFVQCLSTEFISPQKLTCTTSSVLREIGGNVVVHFNFSYTSFSTSNVSFSYVKPTIFSVFPSRGPKSGGTRLVVKGNDMDAGLFRTVKIGHSPCTSLAGHICDIIESSYEKVICRTSAGNITNGRVGVTFDLGCEEGTAIFSYVEDPVVNEFQKLTSIISGGLHLSIRGTGFDSVQEAFLEFTIGNANFRAACSNSSEPNTSLVCVSPNISGVRRNLPFLLPSKNVSLFMDGVTTYLNIGPFFPGTRNDFFLFFSDPVYFPLPTGDETIRIPYGEQKQGYVTIQGDNLTLASSIKDVNVKIGPKECFVFDLTKHSVSCRLDNSEIEPKMYDVMVLHGFLKFNVGQIEYQKPALLPLTLFLVFLSGILSLVLIFILCMFICYYLKAREGPYTGPDTSHEMKEKEKRSYSFKNRRRQTSAELSQRDTDKESDINFEDDMYYMEIPSNRGGEITNGSKILVLEEKVELQEDILKEERVFGAEATINLVESNMIENNDEPAFHGNDSCHYSRHIADLTYQSMASEDEDMIKSWPVAQHSDTVDFFQLGDRAEGFEEPVL